MLSNSVKYAIKAVLFLSVNSRNKKITQVKDIAQSIKVPRPYIAKLLQELSRQKLISSKRGPRGGFYLSADNMNEPLINIVVAIDGEKRLHSCVLELEKCNLDAPCPMHHIVYPTKSKFIEYLTSETIGTFSKNFTNGDKYFTEIDL